MIKKAETKKERLMAMSAKMLGMVCVNGKGDQIICNSDYDRLTEKKEDKKMYDSEMFEKFIFEAIEEGVKRYEFWEKSMKEIERKLAEKKETRKLIKELEAEYESKRG